MVGYVAAHHILASHITMVDVTIALMIGLRNKLTFKQSFDPNHMILMG